MRVWKVENVMDDGGPSLETRLNELEQDGWSVQKIAVGPVYKSDILFVICATRETDVAP